jgi:uncharacterized protein YqeY
MTQEERDLLMSLKGQVAELREEINILKAKMPKQLTQDDIAKAVKQQEEYDRIRNH